MVSIKNLFIDNIQLPTAEIENFDGLNGDVNFKGISSIVKYTKDLGAPESSKVHIIYLGIMLIVNPAMKPELCALIHSRITRFRYATVFEDFHQCDGAKSIFEALEVTRYDFGDVMSEIEEYNNEYFPEYYAYINKYFDKVPQILEKIRSMKTHRLFIHLCDWKCELLIKNCQAI